MLLSDFICYVRTVPEESKKYGKRVCMAGVSAEYGSPIRIYPMLLDVPLKARHMAQLDVIKNPDDNRRESYKLIDAVDSVRSISERAMVSVDGIFESAKRIGYSTIRRLNEERASLGFICPVGKPSIRMVARNELTDPRQQLLFDEFAEDAQKHEFRFGATHPLIPYVDFWDEDGRHSLQLREWGAFEFLRKYPDNPNGLLRLTHANEDREFVVMVGNQMHNRTSWMALSVWSRSRTGQLGLLSEVA